MTVSILRGDCRALLPTIPDNSFDCIVTSPPYFWARDYGHPDQIGHESTLEEYVLTIGGVFDECKRILKDTGTAWLNIGDSYYSGNGQPKGSDPRSPSRNFMREKLRPLDCSGWSIPKKSLCGVPWLVALELQRRGWTLRADIIWRRETALAEPSVKDRPHRQHEYIFLLAKSRWYSFDRSALTDESVWNIPHQRGLRGHSAAFPEELVERCIKAGCPEGGSVLDPFSGAGTTGLVASRLGRKATLIEINGDYVDLAENRLGVLFSNVRAAAAALKETDDV